MLQTLMTKWLRAVIKNNVRASVWYYIFFKTSVNAHFNRRDARRK